MPGGRDPPAEVLAALARMGLAVPGEAPRFHRLEGGVSSDIWRVDLAGGPVCVKRALPRLRVAAHWEAPVERNLYEARWFRRAGAAVPGSAPRVLGQDEAEGILVVEWLGPATHALWKEELRAGRADPAFAAAVGGRLAAIHGATAGDPDVARDFATDRIFHDIRLEPYLLATARAHPDRAPQLEALARRTAGLHLALVHGDVSPKNILAGPAGPVFLDAECAWYGDPAFDIAFCLNHLLLKCLMTPAAAPLFLGCFDALAGAWRRGVGWEPADGLERRAASLLPALLLARIDGKSPVEYVTAEEDKALVRRVGRALLAEPPARLAAVRAAWAQAIGR